VLEDQGQDLDHLAITAGCLEKVLLQSPEGCRQLCEGRTVAQGTGFALNDRQIVPPVIDRLASAIM